MGAVGLESPPQPLTVTAAINKDALSSPFMSTLYTTNAWADAVADLIMKRMAKNRSRRN